MTSCLICLGSVPGDDEYHPDCVKSLFGTTTLPKIDVELSKLYSLAAVNMAGKMSISGAQEKVSLTLSADGRSLEVSATGGRYILKPEISRFTLVPENEQLTMRMARLVGIDVPPLGLVRLKDQTTAYIIRRFDRLDDGSKLAVEDFCQLAGKRIRDKYDGSAELCEKLLRRHATEPLIEIRKLFRLLLYSWWTANGDMHLKNLSLITTRDGIHRLSPAYDLVCTKLVIPDDRLAMPVGGRDNNLTRRTWLDFARYCQIPDRAAKRLISDQVKALEPAMQFVAASYLSDEMKAEYEEILRQNTAVLAGSASTQE